MREILFRGKRTNDREWVQGYVYQIMKDVYIFWSIKSVPDRARVISETVGQYTGVKDRNGKKIFEGDIVRFNRGSALGWATQRVGEVRYYDELPIYYIYANTGDSWDWCECYNILVIGNIYDNPDLLKEDE